MLVLGVYEEESVYITCPCGEVIRVVYMGNRTRKRIGLGFEADRSVDIQRESIYKEKANDNSN